MTRRWRNCEALDIGRWREPAFRGERILTLEEALEIFAGNVDLCLEIKAAVGAPPGIELKLLFILSHYDYLERTVISSFDYRSLARVRELAPDAAIGVHLWSRLSRRTPSPPPSGSPPRRSMCKSSWRSVNFATALGKRA